MSEEKQEKEALYENRFTLECHIRYEGDKLMISAPDTPEAKFIYSFKEFMAITSLNENVKKAKFKKLFSAEERDAIRKAEFVLKKHSNDLWMNVLMHFRKAQEEATKPEPALEPPAEAEAAKPEVEG